ncbi:MAG: hypothetical protein ACI9OI_002038, partial [Chitinophagales bacterium]
HRNFSDVKCIVIGHFYSYFFVVVSQLVNI